MGFIADERTAARSLLVSLWRLSWGGGVTKEWHRRDICIWNLPFRRFRRSPWLDGVVEVEIQVCSLQSLKIGH